MTNEFVSNLFYGTLSLKYLLFSVFLGVFFHGTGTSPSFWPSKREVFFLLFVPLYHLRVGGACDSLRVDPSASRSSEASPLPFCSCSGSVCASTCTPGQETLQTDTPGSLRSLWCGLGSDLSRPWGTPALCRSWSRICSGPQSSPERHYFFLFG